MDAEAPAYDPLVELRADCESCAGLCCVAPAFSASPEFAIDKAAHVACPHLTGRFRCAIHDELAERGFRGCVAYDCHGAGQKVTQLTFGGEDWLGSPQLATRMFEVFMVMRRLHELLMFLHEARKLVPAEPLYAEIDGFAERIRGLTLASADELLDVDVPTQKRAANDLLLRVGALARAPAGR